MTKFSIWAIVLGLSACTGQDSAKPASEPGQMPAAELRTETPRPNPAEEPSVAKPTSPTELVTVSEEPPEYVKKAVKAGVEASAKSSNEAPTKDGAPAESNKATPSTCKTAFAGLHAVVQELQQADAPGAPGRMPSQTRFLQLCESLPPPAQECLVVSYALEHQAHCQSIEAGLAPEHKRALRGLLAQGPSTTSTTGPSAQ